MYVFFFQQNVQEAEVIVENGVSMTNGNSVESDEAPSSPPPAIPVDPPLIKTTPAITEDLASVTAVSIIIFYIIITILSTKDIYDDRHKITFVC